MMDPISLLQSLFLFDPSKPLIFTQFYFWAFFAVVFALFALVHSKILLRNAFLFFASLFFYYKTSGSYIVRRVDPFVRVKEKCDKCEGYGYDYLVIERSKEGR